MPKEADTVYAAMRHIYHAQSDKHPDKKDVLADVFSIIVWHPISGRGEYPEGEPGQPWWARLLREKGRGDAVPFVRACFCPEPLSSNADGLNKPEPKKRPPVTQVAAAAIVKQAGVNCTTRTIRNWEDGVGTPQGWPGLNDVTAIKAFAATHATRKGLNQALKRTVRVSNMDNLPNRVVRR